MKRPIFIEIRQDGFTKAYSMQERKLPNYDVIAEDYPEDYTQNVMKYVIENDNSEAIIRVRPDIEDWEAYQLYLENFDFENEKIALSYEEWKLEKGI